MALSKLQKEILNRQLRFHKNKKYTIDIFLSNEHVLKNFVVYPNVLRPEMNAATFFARFLFFNNGMYLGKTCLDMGCGSGIDGVVMGLYGAKRVVFSDISEEAVENTKDNIFKFKLTKKSKVLRGDLFEKVRSRFDLIVFNHPFFGENPYKGILAAHAVMESGLLIQRFLKEAKRYLAPGGKILMPFLDLAGITNNPAIQGEKHSYRVTIRAEVDFKKWLPAGKVLIYELQK